jgi:asparaginyl-tRNA synthetase
MDVLVPRIGEIIGGSQREHRLAKLEARLKELNMVEADYAWYFDLNRYGAVPHAGFGLGFERLVMLCTAMTNIRDVIPFPRAPGLAPC